MGREEQLIAGGFCPLFEHNQIADGIGMDAVRPGLGLGTDKVPHFILPAGYAAEGAQLLEQVQHFSPSSPRVRRKAASSLAPCSISRRSTTSMGVCI